MDIIYDFRADNLDQLVDFSMEELIFMVVAETIMTEDFNDNIEVSVSVVNNEEIQQLNKHYRNKDVVTDVLSFPLIDDFESKEYEKQEVIALGDIVISIDRANEQALDFGHSLKREVGFLVAHSMLHLLGYDHMTDDEEKCMIEKQDTILQNIGLSR